MASQHMKPHHVKKLLSMHAAGATVGEISQEIGFSCDAIRARLNRMGLEPNKKQGTHQMTVSHYDEQEARERSIRILSQMNRRQSQHIQHLMRLP